jgi:T4-like virus tail tube protein gp19
MPANINPLNPNGFIFAVQKLPELSFFCQQVSLPELRIGVAHQASSVHDIKIPGETAEYTPLSLSFLVDENFSNWKAVYNWMIGLTYPEGHFLYSNFLKSATNANSRTELAKGYSDATLYILDNTNSPLQSITFVDAFPVSLSALPFDSTTEDVKYLTATVDFEYSYYVMN